jgi:DHA1 family multidrug resistance protein-like MFS transporter
LTIRETNDGHLRSLRLSVFLASLPFGMLVIALPLIAREMGVGALAIGGLFAVYSLIIVVVQPFAGRGLDRYGRRPFLIAGLLGYAFSNAIFGLTSGVGGLYLAQLAQGVGSGLVWLAVLAVVSDLAPADRRGEEFGRVEEMAFRGLLVGSLVGFGLLRLLGRDDVGSGLTLMGGWRVLFIGYTATTLIAAAIVWQGVPETLRRKRDRAGEAVAVSGDQQADRGEGWRIPGQLRILMGIVVLTATAAALLSPILTKYLSDNVSSNIFTLGLAFLPAAVAGSVLPSRLGGLSDRFGRRAPMIIALLVGGLAALAVPLVQSLWPLALLWVIEAAAFAAATPAEEALVIDIAGGDHQGTALGYYTAAAALGGVIGPLLGGWIYDRFAEVGAFGTSALLMVLGAGSIMLFVREPLRVDPAVSLAVEDR